MAVREFGVRREDFATTVEREVFDFITEYASTNRGKTPDYRTVVERFPDFYYREGVTDSYRYLVGELKSYAAKRAVVDMFAGNPDERGKPTQPTVEDIINENDGNLAIEDLISRLE